jgi:hypothetical protein
VGERDVYAAAAPLCVACGDFSEGRFGRDQHCVVWDAVSLSLLAVARHGRTAMAVLRLNWGGLGRWISDQIRQQEIDEGSQFAASQRGVLSNLRY